MYCIEVVSLCQVQMKGPTNPNLKEQPCLPWINNPKFVGDHTQVYIIVRLKLDLCNYEC